MTWLPPPRKHRPTTAERIEAAGRMLDVLLIVWLVPICLTITGVSLGYSTLRALIADEPTAIERME